jgi:hypothetical protein
MSSSTVDRRFFAFDPCLGWKEAVQCTTGPHAAGASNIVLSGLQVIDGYQTVAAEPNGNPTRVLVNGQDDQTENGIYYAQDGQWALAPDSVGATNLVTGTLVFVINGSDFPRSMWYCSSTNPNVPGNGTVQFLQIFFS